MPIPVANILEITEEHLQGLLGLPETETIDFKRDTYGRDDDSKRELCKDVSAFANTFGGDIVIGMEEVNSVAEKLTGVDLADIYAEIDRLDKIIRSSIEPRVLGVQFVELKLANGKRVIVIRVPRSLDLPHRVTHRGTNRFYVRHYQSSDEASLQELKRMVQLAGSEFDNAEMFVARRLSRITGGLPPCRLHGKGRGFLVVHIVPFGYSNRVATLDLAKAHDNDAWARFLPPESSGGSRFFSSEGLVVYSPGQDARMYTLVLRSGAVEYVCSNQVQTDDRHGEIVSVEAIAVLTFSAVSKFIPLLRAQGANGPWIVTATLVQCQSARCSPSRPGDPWPRFGQALVDELVTFPTALIEQDADDLRIATALAQMLDAMWQTAGIASAPTDFLAPTNRR